MDRLCTWTDIGQWLDRQWTSIGFPVQCVCKVCLTTCWSGIRSTFRGLRQALGRPWVGLEWAMGGPWVGLEWALGGPWVGHGPCPKFVQALSYICLVIVNSQYLSSFCPHAFMLRFIKNLDPNFVQVLSYCRVTRLSVIKWRSQEIVQSLSCTFLMNYAQKMKTRIGQKVDSRTKAGFEEDKSWI